MTFYFTYCVHYQDGLFRDFKEGQIAAESNNKYSAELKVKAKIWEGIINKVPGAEQVEEITVTEVRGLEPHLIIKTK